MSKITKEVLLASLALLFIFTGAAAQAFTCDSTYVKQKGTVLYVLPTGVDDTAHIQCALDYAAALGPGVTVQLSEGTYKTAQLFIEGFSGTIRGVSQAATIVRNLDTPLPMLNPDTFRQSPPSRENPYPTLLMILGKDVVLSDLTIEVIGAEPVSSYDLADWGVPDARFLHAVITAMGSNIQVRAERLQVAGSGCRVFPGGNVLAGIDFWTWDKEPLSSASRLSVTDSVFAGSCTGTTIMDFLDGAVNVRGNVFKDSVIYGFNFSDVSASTFEARQNEFQSRFGFMIWPGDIGMGIADSAILVSNNRFSGLVGVFFQEMGPDPILRGDVSCAFLGNNVEHVGDVGYWLMPGSRGCTVVGGTHGTVIADPTAHTIVGLTPHTGGVGPAVSELLRTMRPFGWR